MHKLVQLRHVRGAHIDRFISEISGKDVGSLPALNYEISFVVAIEM